MKPPAEYIELLAQQGKSTNVVWKLHCILPGQRIAGAGWVDDASERLEREGFDRNEALPQFFWHRKDKVLIEMHMCDFHGCGPLGVVDRHVARLRSST